MAAGTGDNMAAALGVGLGPGDVVVSIGTSGTVFAVSDTPTADATGAVASFADATGRFLPLVCTLNATKVTDAVARVLGVDAAGLDTLALGATERETRDVGNAPVLVPYFDGERVPNRPDATGRIEGLRSDVTREAFASAAYRGVVCGLLDGLDALAAAGVPTTGRLLLVGGGARSAAYRHTLADLAGRTRARAGCGGARRHRCVRAGGRHAPGRVTARGRGRLGSGRGRDRRTGAGRSGRDPGALLGGSPRVASRHAW